MGFYVQCYLKGQSLHSPAPRQRRGLFSALFLTSRQYSTLNGFRVVKTLVPQPHWGRYDVVFRPFPQGLVVETKPLLYKFCTFVCVTLQYNRVFHVSAYLLCFDTTCTA